jgi:hypothetical protein
MMLSQQKAVWTVEVAPFESDLGQSRFVKIFNFSEKTDAKFSTQYAINVSWMTKRCQMKIHIDVTKFSKIDVICNETMVNRRIKPNLFSIT